ncbi:AfsR/SARP family transcriptional regulator [Jiangella alkaliphila]|uniref:DNA-binding transcriptional activator of the SARP family n=1 Tax=Jiangella alkaliphila TaxID=419479 RepID=A0A1H2LSU4_9ACTN|nr:BTAD domain-containing putative transcriptional regulator [Jiangella alkaliphila]SDU83671.1 DNA-binding transcriptional activator of the SARP family [Jiangella alkaliphila]
MKYGVLGPLVVHDDLGGTVAVTSAKQRLLLAVLLTRRNTLVSADALLDALWGGRPPRSARANLQSYVHRLRRLLGEDRIVHQRSGYQLEVRPGEADDEEFERLAGEGRAARAAGDVGRAAELLHRAATLWRGPDAYAGVPESGAVEPEAARLGELRLAVTELRIDADLERGQDDLLVAELSALVNAYPLRQRLYRQLMLALHRSGRTGDALDVYRQARTTLVEELGLEPGPELRDLEQAILTDDPALAAPPPATRPATRPAAELPPADAAFTGRRDEVRRVTAWLTDGAGRHGAGRPAVVAISGPGGVGKSALALRAAHTVAETFPDGQLYVNLRGATPGVRPLRPHDVLVRLLGSLGVDERQVPGDPSAAAALFRSTVAGRRLLIVLDDADSAAQVRPLLPGPGAGPALLVTSRRVLATIAGAHRLALGTLPPDEAVDLLAALAGPGRVTAEPEAAADVVTLCGLLPLAVRVAGARLLARPDWTLSSLRDRLDDAQHRLDELEHDDLAVRASCDVAFDALPEAPAAVFTSLGLAGFADFTVHTAAALAGRPLPATRRALDQLVEAQLLIAAPDDRFTLHDLVRLYARERAERTLTPSGRDDALRRALHHYLATARNASRMSVAWSDRHASIGPATTGPARAGADPAGPAELPDGAAISAWVRAESDNIAAAAIHAAALDGDGPAILAGLAAAMAHPLRSQDRWTDLVAIGRLALATLGDEADDGAGHARWRSKLHQSLSDGYFMLDRLPEAQHHGLEAVRASHEGGDRHGEADARSALGFILHHLNRTDEAFVHYRRALRLQREIADPKGQALTLTRLGVGHHRSGRLDEAIACQERALRLDDSPHLTGIAWFRLGDAHLDAGRPERALDCFERAIEAFQACGSSVDEALARWLRGDILRLLGRDGDARHSWSRSTDLLREMRSLTSDEAGDLLGAPVPRMPAVLRRGRDARHPA